MSLEADITNLQKLRAEITDLKERYKIAKQQLIEIHHPHKVGDIVTVTGSAYKDKKMVITHISMEHHENITPKDSRYWWASGNVLKKDGTPGKNEGHWMQQI